MPVSSTGRECLSHFPCESSARNLHNLSGACENQGTDTLPRVCTWWLSPSKPTVRLVTTAYRLSLDSQSRTIAGEVLMNNAGWVESGIAKP